MTPISFSFHLSYFNPLMLTNMSNKLFSSYNCCNFSPCMYLFLWSLQKSSWWYVMYPYFSEYMFTLLLFPLGTPMLFQMVRCSFLPYGKFPVVSEDHWIYSPKCFLLVCHPLGGRNIPWSFWGRLWFWTFYTWMLGNIPGWCHWLMSHYWWRSWPGHW